MAKDDDSSLKNKIKDLTRVPSIGKLTARALIDSDYDSISKLKEADLEDIESVYHLGEGKAKDILEELKEESYEKEGIKEDITHEFRCPICDNLIGIKDETCPECDEQIEIRGGVIVPEHGMIENPKEKLAEVEEKLWNGEEDAESWYIRGAILERMGAHHEALESYNRVIELDPFFDHIWNSKAKASLKVGNTQDAAKAYKLAFDIQGLPENIKYEIERENVTSAQEIEELQEKDEEEKKAYEKITEAREKLDQLAESDIDVSEMTSLLDKSIEKRLEGKSEEALSHAEEVIEKGEIISNVREDLAEVKERLEDVDYDTVENKVEKDIEQINEMIEEGEYDIAGKLAKNLSYGLEFESKKEEKKEVLLEELQSKISKVEGIMEELSKDFKELIDIDESISEAEKALEDDDLEKASKSIGDILKNENRLKNISDLMDKIETMSMGLEGIDADQEVLEELDEEYEEGKKVCKEGKYEEAEGVFDDLLTKIEEKIDETVKTTEEEISNIKEKIEDQISRAEEQNLDIEDFKQTFEELEEKVESGESEEEVLADFQKLKEKGEYIVEFRSIISKIDKKIEEYEGSIDMERFREDVENISTTFEERNFENAIDDAEELLEEIEEEIETYEEETVQEDEAEDRIGRARKKLADIRRSDFDINGVKNLLKKSAKAKKQGDLRKSIEFAEEMIETADEMLEISELEEEIREKIEELDEKDLIDKKVYVNTIDRYQKLVDIGRSDLADKYLKGLSADLEEASEKEKMLPPQEEEEVINSAKYIKEKVKNLKEFKSLIEESGIEIQFDKEYLKNAIVKIKDMEYEEAGEILAEGKKALLKRLDEKLEDRLSSMAEEMGKFDDAGSKGRIKAMIEESKNKWTEGDKEGALKNLVELSNYVENLSDKDSLLSRRKYTISKTIEDIEDVVDTEEIKELLEKSREEDIEEKRMGEIIVDIKDILEDELEKSIDERSDTIEKTLDETSDKNRSVLAGNFSKAKKSIERNEPERAAWYLGEYNRKNIADGSNSED